MVLVVLVVLMVLVVKEGRRSWRVCLDRREVPMLDQVCVWTFLVGLPHLGSPWLSRS